MGRQTEQGIEAGGDAATIARDGAAAGSNVRVPATTVPVVGRYARFSRTGGLCGKDAVARLCCKFDCKVSCPRSAEGPRGHRDSSPLKGPLTQISVGEFWFLASIGVAKGNGWLGYVRGERGPKASLLPNSPSSFPF